MNYIVFDLEFNQSFDFKTGSSAKSNPECPFEIIQIGAVKLNSSFETIGHFNRYIKPVIYKRIHPYVEKITAITQDDLKNGDPFAEVFRDLCEFVSPDDILCSWGADDIKSLYRNIKYHSLPSSKIPDRNINIASDFHNALNDAEYTVEVFRIVKPEILITERFKPSDIKSVKPKIKAKRINTKSMFKYFSQSLERELTSEEKAIIKTAYKLGRNNTYDL